MNCQPSLLKDGSSTALRERLFTSWMSPAQLQDHMKRMAALGMVPLYSTFVPGAGFREIYWRPQVPVYFEVRSARTREQFLEFQRGNAARGWPLLTLHVSAPGDFHSAVWMDAAGHADARPVLEGLGIGLATVSEDGPL